MVTGGGRGIGEAIVRRLLAEGASVVTCARDAGRLAELRAELGDGLVTVAADVAVEADVMRVTDAAVDRFGRIDAAFNVAGVAGGTMLVDTPEHDWDRVVDINLKGVFLAMKHEARQLIRQGNGGAIVNVASLNSDVPMFANAGYCASKAGVAMLTKCGAIELAEHAIRVNTVSPGLIATPLSAPIMAVDGATEAFLDFIPLDRVGRPDDVAAAALYLGCDDAGYISGVNLLVDGAWSVAGYPDLRPFAARMSGDGSDTTAS